MSMCFQVLKAHVLDLNYNSLHIPESVHNQDHLSLIGASTKVCTLLQRDDKLRMI